MSEPLDALLARAFALRAEVDTHPLPTQQAQALQRLRDALLRCAREAEQEATRLMLNGEKG